MNDLTRFRERYMRDPAPVRLGNLASDLLRLGAWVQMRRPDDSIIALLTHIAAMLECNGGLELVELADMQREICRWRRVWPVEQASSVLVLRSQQMSARALELAAAVSTNA